MSLEFSRQADRDNPSRLQTNIASTCYAHTVALIALLRAAGRTAFHVCKTEGEGQYTPPGFNPRTVKGMDGKDYIVTGVSHDAIWCEGEQFDTIASGNDADRKIYQGPNGASFDPSAGPQIVGSPSWNAIPEKYWRPQNPPLREGDGMPVPVPVPQPPAHEPYPGDAPFDAVGAALFADYAQAGNAPDPQMGRWFGRTIYDWLGKNEPTLDASIKKHRAEWRGLLGLPPQ